MSDEPDTTITVYPDGPLLIRGTYRVVNARGEQFTQARPTVALCRCGKSAIKPWCDGTHKTVKFISDPPGASV